ncbi:hypothetical protein ACFY05_23475 [Microtetraspora fusca]|uniref:Uncharacterized protein n=1 Tax=Microtetraspora fusca TaxID=1997 RepID=A0ABW6V934_MICFU
MRANSAGWARSAAASRRPFEGGVGDRVEALDLGVGQAVDVVDAAQRFRGGEGVQLLSGDVEGLAVVAGEVSAASFWLTVQPMTLRPSSAGKAGRSTPSVAWL